MTDDQPVAPTRPCGYCERPLVQKRGEPKRNFAKRRFCNPQCGAWWYYNGERPNPDDPRLEHRLPPLPQVEFPGARFATVAEAPDCCRCGGSWRVLAGALHCGLCGRDVYVRELLMSPAAHRFVATAA